MIFSRITPPAATALAAACLLHQPAAAQLPTFSEGDNLGYFATYNDSRMQFGITAGGELRLMPTLSRGFSASFQSGTYALEIAPRVIAAAADGKETRRRIVDTSLTTDGAVTDKFGQATIRGEFTGGVKFEFPLQQNKGVLLIGGRLAEGQEFKTPHRFELEIKVPAQLSKARLDTLSKLTQGASGDRAARRELRDFMRDFRDDRLSVRRIDGTEARYPLADPIEGGVAAVNGAGIAELELQSGIYEARRLVITAENGSALAIVATTRENQLLPGFILAWKSDPAKDPEAKARMAISVR